LLYSTLSPLHEKMLAEYLEQSRLQNYRRVLDKLHQTRMVEWNKSTGVVTISPVGSKEVEDRLLQ